MYVYIYIYIYIYIYTYTFNLSWLVNICLNISGGGLTFMC